MQFPSLVERAVRLSKLQNDQMVRIRVMVSQGQRPRGWSWVRGASVVLLFILPQPVLALVTSEGRDVSFPTLS